MPIKSFHSSISTLAFVIGCAGAWGEVPHEPLEQTAWPVYTMPWNIVGEGALDLSRLLDAPAGKHGFLQSRGNQLHFADGVRARFWGVNLVAAGAFPRPDQSKQIARRLAHAGCNMVRLHHLDAPWHRYTIFDRRRPNTQHLDSERLDRLDHLIAELKEVGIYIHLDLYVHRQFKEGDDLPETDSLPYGPKHISYTNRRMVELQKQYAHDLLTHINPYTGLRYADDPAIAIVQLVNENSIFWRNQQDLPKIYLDEIDALWNAWLIKRYGSREALDRQWTSDNGAKNLRAEEDPARGNVARPEIGFWQERYFDESYDDLDGPPRMADHFLFLSEIQSNFYREMTEYLRSLGVKCVIDGSNLPNGIWGLRGDVEQGITEANGYFGHPRDGFGIPNRFPDATMLRTKPFDKSPDWGNSVLPTVFSMSRTSQAPLVITEWNEPYPMPYRAEAVPFIAAYGAYQDLDGLCLFSYTHADWENNPSDEIRSFFDSGNDPAVWGLFTAGAMLFHRQDIRPGEVIADIVYNATDLLYPHPQAGLSSKGLSQLVRVRQTFVENRYEGDADIAISSGFNPASDLRHAKRALIYSHRSYADPYRVNPIADTWIQRYVPDIQTATETVSVQNDRFCIVTNVNHLARQSPHWEIELIADCLKDWGMVERGSGTLNAGWSITDTGELRHNYLTGVLTIDTPKTQGMVGFGTGQTFQLQSLTIQPKTSFAAIICQSLDDAALYESDHLLVTAVGRVENTGQRWKDATEFIDRGGAPIRMEPIDAQMWLRAAPNRAWRGYVLGADGQRIDSFTVEYHAGSIRWSLPNSTTQGAIHFELVSEPVALESSRRRCTKDS